MSTSVETTTKKTKNSIKEVVGLTIPPSRVRLFMSNHWINQSCEAASVAPNEEILKIMKQGCKMAEPTSPKAPKNPTEEQKTHHKEARKLYEAQLAEWTSYKSTKYTQLKALGSYCKKLQKLQALFEKKSCDSRDYEVACLTALLNDMAPPSKTFGTEESREKAEKARREFKSRGYKAHQVATTKLDSKDNVELEVIRVCQENPEVRLFMAKSNISKERTRFSIGASVAVAAVVETFIRQLAEFTVKKTTAVQAKHMHPEHCVSAGVEELSYYSLVSKLPHWQALVDKQSRRVKYDAKKTKAEKRYRQRNKMLSNRNIKVSREKFAFKSFNETEVEGGHAVVTSTTTNEKGKVKNTYKWWNIDVDHAPLSDIDFTTFVERVCRQEVESFGEEADGVIVGSRLQKFLSDLIIDFMVRLTYPTLGIQQYAGSNTITHDVVLMVVKWMLVDDYVKLQPKVELSADHEMLFSQIGDMIETLKTYYKTRGKKVATEEHHVDELDEEEDDLVVLPKNGQMNGGVKHVNAVRSQRAAARAK